MIARFLALALLVLVGGPPPALAQSSGRGGDVVVELYTSQGCSQCPRANRLLGMLAREADVLALTFPVGIWDYLGWRDTFARPEFSERQRAYAENLRLRGRFTPQLVIDGARQMSASDWEAAREMLNTARTSAEPENSPLVTIARLRNGRIRVTVGAGAVTNADVWLVSYDPGPLAVTIRGGLNIDRTVTHFNLVRSIDRIGGWTGGAIWFERSGCLPECALIVQMPQSGPILAAAHTGRRR
jgi:hypothetical protein